MSLIIPANSAVGGGFEVANSLRFDDGSTDYLSRTPSSAGSQQKFTFSVWVKRCTLGYEYIFSQGYNGNNNNVLVFNDDNSITVWNYQGGFQYLLKTDTDVLFRDVSAWYHFIVAVDTTQATASDRVNMYVNGNLITDFRSGEETYPSLNTNLIINTTNNFKIGTYWDTSIPFDGYMSEVCLIDGQQLDPTSFGEFDENSGIWKPIDVSGLTFGTNGFYLDFQNSGSLGADVSGNGNNFTPTNLASTDQMLDTPTNNFATLNLLFPTDITYSEGNLKTLNTTTGNYNADPTYRNIIFDQYAEGYVVSVGSNTANHRLLLAIGGVSNVQYRANGEIRIGNTLDTTVASYTNGDIISAYVSLDDEEAYFFKNNTLVYTYSATGMTSIERFQFRTARDNGSWIVNFGQDSSFAGTLTRQNNTDANGIGDFYYSTASNAYALCTKNIATELPPAINDGSQYFNTVLYTSTGVDPLSVTGVGFQPDAVWIKSRSGAFSHNIYDAVRGVRKRLQPNLTNAESTISGVKSFDTDGFTLGANTNDTNNTSGYTYVAWNWLAGGTASSNTDGSITSSVSANQDAGFSIVSYTGNGTDNATIGHGLGIKPDCLIVKNRDDGTDGWGYWNKGMGAETQQMALNLTNAAFTDDVFKSSSSITVTLGTDTWSNVNTEKYIMYAFAEKRGYSKFGSYTGNGSSTNGAFVYTGFKPAWFMIKRTNSTESWYIHDNKRDTFNPSDKHLLANSSNAENPQEDIDLLSNGIKIRSTDSGYNASGSTYIYMAFAENPFVTSTGIPVTAR